MSSVNRFPKLLIRTVLILYTLSFSLYAFAQQKEIDSSMNSKFTDSIKVNYISEVKKMLKAGAEKRNKRYNTDKLIIKQDEILENIKKTVQAAKNDLKKGLDTSEINIELENILKWNTVTGDGVFTNKGTAQTNRNLSLTKALIVELIKIANDRKTQIDKYYLELINHRYKIDSLSSDTALFTIIGDSASISQYMQKLTVLIYEVSPTDSSLLQTIKNVRGLQTRINYIVSKLKYSLDEIETYETELSEKILSKEFSMMWEPVTFNRPFSEIINVSIEKNIMLLRFYSENNMAKIMLLIFLIAALTLHLKVMKAKLTNAVILKKDYSSAIIFRYPFLSAIIIILNLFQFIFQNPPYIFILILWITSSISLTLIYRGYISKFWMYTWIVLSTLFLIASANNMILQASRTERWVMLCISLTGIIVSSLILIKSKKYGLKEKRILFFVGFVILLEILSIISDLFGRYNLSKNLFATGFINIVIAILFLITARLFNETLSFTKAIYNNPDRQLSNLNLKNIIRKTPVSLSLFLLIGWFIILVRNFHIFQVLSKPLERFIFDERTIGDYTFTLKNILLFLLIIIISFILSKTVSFFADYENSRINTSGKDKKKGLGSWVLLIRIAIFSIGVFLAFAAVGIPMERITIILGTLGVGIGFGLQALVNSLVSGIIISFEKPVNVGDVVEISGQSGRIRSIGFRSSIISRWDGAEVVIPNGDLLNSHMVNWTLDKSTRRVEVIVGVAYGTDLQRTKEIIYGLVKDDKRILQKPAPNILFLQFEDSAVSLKLMVWVSHYLEGEIIKSDLISYIHTAFRENNIQIPFPQQDIHLYTSDDNQKKEGDNK